MKFSALLFIFLFCSCRTTTPAPSGDQFEQILQLMKSEDPAKVESIFGAPDKTDSSDPKYEMYLYESQGDRMPMKIFIDRKNNKVFSLALTYWVNFDAYAFLKKRFKNFQWNEEPIKSIAVDVVEERFKVQIPELEMTFEYNNQDPLRRPMWIYFK
jgi:hypothetical protein